MYLLSPAADAVDRIHISLNFWNVLARLRFRQGYPLAEMGGDARVPADLREHLERHLPQCQNELEIRALFARVAPRRVAVERLDPAARESVIALWQDMHGRDHPIFAVTAALPAAVAAHADPVGENPVQIVPDPQDDPTFFQMSGSRKARREIDAKLDQFQRRHYGRPVHKRPSRSRHLAHTMRRAQAGETPISQEEAIREAARNPSVKWAFTRVRWHGPDAAPFKSAKAGQEWLHGQGIPLLLDTHPTDSTLAAHLSALRAAVSAYQQHLGLGTLHQLGVRALGIVKDPESTEYASAEIGGRIDANVQAPLDHIAEEDRRALAHGQMPEFAVPGWPGQYARALASMAWQSLPLDERTAWRHYWEEIGRSGQRRMPSRAFLCSAQEGWMEVVSGLVFCRPLDPDMGHLARYQFDLARGRAALTRMLDSIDFSRWTKGLNPKNTPPVKGPDGEMGHWVHAHGKTIFIKEGQPHPEGSQIASDHGWGKGTVKGTQQTVPPVQSPATGETGHWVMVPDPNGGAGDLQFIPTTQQWPEGASLHPLHGSGTNPAWGKLPEQWWQGAPEPEPDPAKAEKREQIAQEKAQKAQQAAQGHQPQQQSPPADQDEKVYYNGKYGQWVIINGHPVFIEDGQPIPDGAQPVSEEEAKAHQQPEPEPDPVSPSKDARSEEKPQAAWAPPPGTKPVLWQGHPLNPHEPGYWVQNPDGNLDFWQEGDPVTPGMTLHPQHGSGGAFWGTPTDTTPEEAAIKAANQHLNNPGQNVKFDPDNVVDGLTLNGIAFEPVPGGFWQQHQDIDFGEGPLAAPPPGGWQSAGIVVMEPDGRVWCYQPQNQHGGMNYSLSKGRIDEGETAQQSALREVWEELGIQAEIVGYLGDKPGSVTQNRYYIGVRKGGSPWAAKPDETAAVHLMTPAEAASKLSGNHVQVFQMAQEWIGQHGQPEAGKPVGVKQPEPEPEPQQEWPADPSTLQDLGSIGGSNHGRKLYDPATGKTYSWKGNPNNPHQVENEVLADRVYQILGAPVPASKLYHTPSGPMKLSEWKQGESVSQYLGHATQEEKDALDTRLTEAFGAHVLLGNYDLPGFSGGNFVVDSSGTPWVIDSGASFDTSGTGKQKQGTGDHKPTWDTHPVEFFLMSNDPDFNAPWGQESYTKGSWKQASRLFGHMTLGEKLKSVRHVLDHRQEIENAVAGPHSDVIRQRLDYLQKMVDTAEAELAANPNGSGTEIEQKLLDQMRQDSGHPIPYQSKYSVAAVQAQQQTPAPTPVPSPAPAPQPQAAPETPYQPTPEEIEEAKQYEIGVMGHDDPDYAFPETYDPAAFTEVKKLGGFGGSSATLVQDAQGRKFVRKTGGAPGHLHNEYLADMMYRSLGVNVPAARFYDTPSGPVKLAEYIPNAVELAHYWQTATPQQKAKVNAQLQQHFAIDAFLGNWDVLGSDKRNILIDQDGDVWRCDNGGALEYRAQGQRKGTDGTPSFDEWPMELWTMRRPDKAPAGSNAPQHFNGTPWHFGSPIGDDFAVPDDAEGIIPQILRLYGEHGDLEAMIRPVAPKLWETLDARMRNMVDVAAASNHMRSDYHRDSYVDDFGYHMMGVGRAGILSRLPARLQLRTHGDGQAHQTLVDPDDIDPATGKPREWDQLRGPDTILKPWAQYLSQHGGNHAVISEWASDQASSSWNPAAKAAKAFIYEQMEDGLKRATQAGELDPVTVVDYQGTHVHPTGIYWGDHSDFSTSRHDHLRSKAKSELTKRRNSHSADVYNTSLTAWHAFMYQVMNHVQLPNVNHDRKTITLIRELSQSDLDKVPEIGAGARKGVYALQALTASYALVHGTNFGSAKTVTELPIHRVYGFYAIPRGPESWNNNQAMFLGGYEAEILANSFGLPFDIVTSEYHAAGNKYPHQVAQGLY